MKILFCAEQFPPSVGGVSKVIYEITKNLAILGQDIHVATSFAEKRNLSDFPFPIHQFKIRGNSIRGIIGEREKYIDFLKNEKFDVIYIKAAQQWSFDLVLENLKSIPSKIAFLPCGFPNLFDPKYEDYYKQIREKAYLFSGIFFNSEQGNDFTFFKEFKGLPVFFIHNGASEEEFVNLRTGFRKHFLIGEESTVLISVGNPRVQKGQFEMAKIFDELKIDRKVVLVLIGDKITGLQMLARKVYRRLRGLPPDQEDSLYAICQKYSNATGNKRIICTSLSRRETIAAFFDSDLFVFLSKIEYAPLVLFEAMASGLFFLSMNVGNSKDIANLCESGIVVNRIDEFKTQLEAFLKNPVESKRKGQIGRQYWMDNLTWKKLSLKYLEAFETIVKRS
jgi:glycosyltransferase involved in cell wall biosynthesis